MTGRIPVQGLSGPDVRELDRLTLHPRICKQHGTKRAGPEMRKTSKLAVHRAGWNDGPRVYPGAITTQQVYLANNGALTTSHVECLRLVQPRRPPLL